MSASEVERYQFRSLAFMGEMYDSRGNEMHRANGTVFVVAASYDVLLAERDRLAGDAARYRWIRSQGGSWETEAFLSGITPEQYDAAIDAAMQPEGGK